VVQHSPKSAEATYFGLTLWDPEIFSRKWTTFLYHPERGFSNTRLGVTRDTPSAGEERKAGVYQGVRGYLVLRENFVSLEWGRADGIPAVILKWNAGDCLVTEEFFVPDRGALLFRRVTLANRGRQTVNARLNLSLYPNFGMFDKIAVNEKTKMANAVGHATMRLFAMNDSATVHGRYDVRVPIEGLAPDGDRTVTYVYAIKGAEAEFRKKPPGLRPTQKYWAEKGSFICGQNVLDHLFDVSRSSLRAAVSRSGRMDGGIWMYNMEWLFDQVLASEVLLRCGWPEEARILLDRNIRENIGPEGQAAESSRWFGFDYTELNHNGTLLYGIWNYLCWTGDLAFVKKHWPTIRRCGDFPLRENFLDPKTRMVHNKREFWERSDTFGIEDGYELAYQFWVSLGLERAVPVARLVGDSVTASRWESAARAMRLAMLEMPGFRLIEDGHFIKRRTVGGQWQQYCIPTDRNAMPPGSPLALFERPDLEPDTAEVFPIVYGMVNGRSELSVKTLEWVESLWNQRWSTGGYARYNTDSEPDPPGAWALCSAIVARAYVEAGNDEKVWQTLNWLYNVHGGRSGGWFERYAQSITPPAPPVGVVPWIWYEIINLALYHVAGFRPQLDGIVLQPRLLTGIDHISVVQIVRGSRYTVEIRRGKPGAKVNGTAVPVEAGRVTLPHVKRGSAVRVEMTV